MSIKEKPKHSGVGRIAKMYMHTISLFESGESNGAVSLRTLFEGDADIAAIADFDIERIAYTVCRGGWPDAVVALGDGRWALVEVKLGSRQLDDASAHLRKLAARIDQEHEGAPSFLMVLTGTATAYRREDGVLVVPLATLAP